MALFDEDFLESISGSVNKFASNAVSSVSDVASNAFEDSLARIGFAPDGNLTAAEIASGKTAGVPVQSASRGAYSTATKAGMGAGMMIAIAVGAYFLLAGRR